MDPTTIFTDISDFRAYTNGLQADTSYAQLKPSIRTVAADIKEKITPAVFEAVASFGSDASDDQKAGKELLKTALASGTMAKYAIFDSVKKNGSEASLYKYQLDEIKAHHAEAFARAMDDLLDWLDANTDTGNYSESPEYADRQSLPIRNAAEFDRYFGIGRSSYFFSKIIYLMRSVWLGKVKALVGDSEDETVIDLGKRILAYRTMAAAVLQFDLTELPRSIRWDSGNEHASGSAMQDRDRLASQFISQAEGWEKNLQVRTSTATAMVSDQNAEENKYYAML